jgi:hypothetical protein
MKTNDDVKRTMFFLLLATDHPMVLVSYYGQGPVFSACWAKMCQRSPGWTLTVQELY